MASAKFEWRGAVQMGANCTVYGQKVIEAVKRVADYFAPILESFAKKHGPWVDRTGNLRQALHSWVEEVSNDAVYLYISHGLYYGIFLEKKYSGKYQILWPTLQAHIEPIRQMLQGIFG